MVLAVCFVIELGILGQSRVSDLLPSETSQHAEKKVQARASQKGLLEKARCDYTYRPFKEYRDALSLWATNDETFSTFQYTNLVGEDRPNSPLYWQDFGFQWTGNDTMADANMMAGECSTTDGNVTYRTFRVGPFSAVGNSSWSSTAVRWQPADITGRGPLRLLGYFAGPVTEDGEAIGFPPLHNHHAHMMQDSIPEGPPVEGRDLPDQSVFYAGDGAMKGCTSTGPDACYTTDMRTYGHLYKSITLPISFDILIQDVRPAASEPLTFYVQFTVATSSDETLQRAVVISGKSLAAEPTLSEWDPYDPDRPLSNYFGGARIPSTYDTYNIFAFELPTSGQVIPWSSQAPDIISLHTHNGVFRKQLIFDASFEELLAIMDGMGVRTPDFSGFPLEQNLNCLWAPNDSNDAIIAQVLSTSLADKIVCVHDGEGSQEEVDGLYWDRISPGYCNATYFSKGHIWSGINFYGPPPSNIRDNQGLGTMAEAYNMHVVNHLYAKTANDDPLDIRTAMIFSPKQACASNDTFATAHSDPEYDGYDLNPPLYVSELPVVQWTLNLTGDMNGHI